MHINLKQWIIKGTIAPWTWGISLENFFTILPEARPEIEEQLQLGYPFLTLDDVEFYFEGDEFIYLNEVVIKNWAIISSYQPVYFSYWWLRSGLTFRQVKDHLKNSGLAFSIEQGRLGTSHIYTETGVFFAFYSDSDKADEAELAKVHLGSNLLV